jgi:hypothetical protein
LTINFGRPNSAAPGRRKSRVEIARRVTEQFHTPAIPSGHARALLRALFVQAAFSHPRAQCARMV